MNSYLADTNVLLRLFQKTSPHHPIAMTAVQNLRQSDDDLFIVPQNIVEFWSVATRPISANGLGYSSAVATQIVRPLERIFSLLLDQPEIHEEWQRLVVTYSVTGRQVHDARLVASMIVHGIKDILTFNFADFRRYPMINAIDPATVASGP